MNKYINVPHELEKIFFLHVKMDHPTAVAQPGEMARGGSTLPGAKGVGFGEGRQRNPYPRFFYIGICNCECNE
jgi:hypothetical protein